MFIRTKREYQGLETQIGKLRRGLARLIDSYAEGLIDKQEFEPRVTRMRTRLQHLEAQVKHLKAERDRGRVASRGGTPGNLCCQSVQWAAAGRFSDTAGDHP